MKRGIQPRAGLKLLRTNLVGRASSPASCGTVSVRTAVMSNDGVSERRGRRLNSQARTPALHDLTLWNVAQVQQTGVKLVNPFTFPKH